jgi:glycosyltransferase involved in cell wall biosynthesis
LRIGITLQSLDPTWGGIGIYTEEIVRALLRIDGRNEYVLIHPHFGAGRSRLGQFMRRYDNVREIETAGWPVPIGTWWDQAVVPRFAAAERVDLLFNPFWTAPIRGRFKKVITIHGVERHRHRRVHDLKRRAEWYIHEKLLAAADRIIAISDMMTRDLVEDFGVPQDKIRRIYHGVGEKFRPIRDPERLRAVAEGYRLPERFVLFVGHIYPQKNFANALRSFAAIAGEYPHRLVVAGRPRWHYDEDLALMAGLGIADRVQFLYFVENDDLPAIYSMADLFIFPSLYEAFGLAAVEAMACGCPVAASTAGALPEVLGDAALFFDPPDVAAMTAAMRRLLQEPATRAAQIERGLARAARYSWRRCAEETLALFEELAGRRPIDGAGSLESADRARTAA